MNKENMIPLHIKTETKEDISELVLMPGDPLRAKYIAQNFLEDAKLVTDVRNMLGFTGYYQGKKVTVMGSGMGMPSMMIYSYELFRFYDVKKIIRIGTCGVVDPVLEVSDLLLASNAYSETAFDYSYDSNHRVLVYPDVTLNQNIKASAFENGLKIHTGTLITCDVFGPYIDMEKILKRVPKDIHIVGEEMEAYALMVVGNSFKRQTACLCTVTDSKFSKKVLTPAERQTTLNNMIKVALDAIIK